MKTKFALGVCSAFLIFTCHIFAQSKGGKMDAIFPGVPWFDDRGIVVSAHGANTVKENGRFYLFGEAHSDTSNAFAGFNCYSSSDLYNWKFESIALPVQRSGKLGPNRVGERCKVLKCPATGEFVMLMHTDTLGYKDQAVGYATSKNITGPYVFQGSLLFNGNPIKKWDMGTFQDKDGSGYLLVHSGNIYKLSSDYKSISEHVVKDMEPEGESPAMFRRGRTYYWLASHRSSWERNDNFYYTAPSITGPWTNRGAFAPKGTLTWNSQTTFVLPIEGLKDTTYLFMGDRWSFPKQASSATYVWQPLRFKGDTLSLPGYLESWRINTVSGMSSSRDRAKKVIENNDKRAVRYLGSWQHRSTSGSSSLSRSDVKGSSVSISFKGRQVCLYSQVKQNNGYALLQLKDAGGKNVLSALIDMYCYYSVTTPVFVSPVLPKGNYTLVISTTGEKPNWSDKRKTTYGSTGNFITFDKLKILK